MSCSGNTKTGLLLFDGTGDHAIPRGFVLAKKIFRCSSQIREPGPVRLDNSRLARTSSQTQSRGGERSGEPVGVKGIGPKSVDHQRELNHDSGVALRRVMVSVLAWRGAGRSSGEVGKDFGELCARRNPYRRLGSDHPRDARCHSRRAMNVGRATRIECCRKSTLQIGLPQKRHIKAWFDKNVWYFHEPSFDRRELERILLAAACEAMPRSTVHRK